MQRSKFNRDLNQEGSNFFHFIFSGWDLKTNKQKKSIVFGSISEDSTAHSIMKLVLIHAIFNLHAHKKIILTGYRHCFDSTNHQRHMQYSTQLNIPKYISSFYAFSIRLQKRLKKSEQDLWVFLTFHLYQNE